MSQKFDASTWTGMTNDGRVPDVREAQNPVAGGPIALAEKAYDWRLFNWSIAMQMGAVLAAIAFVSDDWSSTYLLSMAALAIVAYLAVSLTLYFWARRAGQGNAIRLSERGLELPASHSGAIPWQHIGWVEQHLWSGFRMISVQVDPSYKVELRAPWPFRHLNKPVFKIAGAPLTLSCWAIRSDCDALISDLRQYRDNYCAAPTQS